MARRKDTRILVVDDDVHFSRSLKRALESEGYNVRTAGRVAEALQALDEHSPELVLLDLMLQDESGLDVLAEMRRRTVEIPVIALTAVGQVSTVVEVMQAGAINYLVKPVGFDELALAIDNALIQSAVRQEVKQRRNLQSEANRARPILGESAAIEKIRQDIATVAPTGAPVLVTGETGTGKELVSRAIHAAGLPESAPFVAVNCGAVPGELLEAEFFGYRKGAFTGAEKDTIGKMRLAHGGSLMLDEVGEMPLTAQVKFLRALEEKEFYPVGSTELVRVETRIIAATNRGLRDMVDEGRFRRDLYFRLNVFEIYIPPLRERPEDIIVLARSFLEAFSRKFRREPPELTAIAEKKLQLYPWEGNVRELSNVMERAALMGEKEINDDYLDRVFGRPPAAASAVGGEFVLPEEGFNFDDHEKSVLMQALQRVGGNKAKAARLLGMSKATFYYRVDKYGL